MVVNAQAEIDDKWARFKKIPSFGAMLEPYSSMTIGRYNVKTMAP